MNCLYEHHNGLYISNTIYNKNENIDTLFKKKKKSYKPLDISSSSSSFEDDEYLNSLMDDSNDDSKGYCNEYPSDVGGATITKQQSKKSKIFSKIKYLKIMPSFINVIKGRILYNNRSRFTIEPLIPKDGKNVILGILIDLYKIDETVENITFDKIEKYIKGYDVVPLLYNDTRNIIYKNKKTYFFSKKSKLAFLTFKMPSTNKYYIENTDLSPLSKLYDIDENKLSVNSIIAHFIYENYYFLHTQPDKLKIDKCFIIDIENMEFKDIKNVKQIIPNDRKLSIDEIYIILKKGKQMLKF